jgi:probable rRNA maturation factor
MRKAVSLLLEDLKIATDEVALHFVKESKICALHADFFNDPSPTDCITFPLDSPDIPSDHYHILGEAFICPKTAVNYATKRGADPFVELMRYVVHCILHLKGYEDTQPALRKKMKKKELSCLHKVLKNN